MEPLLVLGPLLGALEGWPIAVLLRGSSVVYLLVNAAHILFIGLLLGAIVTLDLRLLGAFPRSLEGLLDPLVVGLRQLGESQP